MKSILVQALYIVLALLIFLPSTAVVFTLAVLYLVIECSLAALRFFSPANSSPRSRSASASSPRTRSIGN